jgi:hypothetical protein
MKVRSMQLTLVAALIHGDATASQGRGTDAHPGAGQYLPAVLPARNDREIAVQLPRRVALAIHPVSQPQVDVHPAAGRSLNAGLCQLRVKIQQAHPVLIQRLLGWIVLAIKINDHLLLGYELHHGRLGGHVALTFLPYALGLRSSS